MTGFAANPSTISVEKFKSEGQVDQLIKMAQEVVNKGQWYPSHAMIDKSHAEFNALKNGEFWSPSQAFVLYLIGLLVWMDINIHLCQFHIIQALICWGKGKPKKSRRGGRAPPHHSLNEDALQELLVLFRQAQRCRDPRTWQSQFPASFNSGIDNLAKKHKCNANVIKTYFNDNWWGTWLGMLFFCLSWLIAIPTHLSRVHHWHWSA